MVGPVFLIRGESRKQASSPIAQWVCDDKNDQPPIHNDLQWPPFNFLGLLFLL